MYYLSQKQKKSGLTLTIVNSIDFVDKTLIGELCGQRSEQVNVTVQEKQCVKHRQDLILASCKLSLHSQHHIGNMLKTNERH